MAKRHTKICSQCSWYQSDLFTNFVRTSSTPRYSFRGHSLEVLNLLKRRDPSEFQSSPSVSTSKEGLSSAPDFEERDLSNSGIEYLWKYSVINWIFASSSQLKNIGPPWNKVTKRLSFLKSFNGNDPSFGKIFCLFYEPTLAEVLLIRLIFKFCHFSFCDSEKFSFFYTFAPFSQDLIDGFFKKKLVFVRQVWIASVNWHVIILIGHITRFLWDFEVKKHEKNCQNSKTLSKFHFFENWNYQMSI